MRGWAPPKEETMTACATIGYGPDGAMMIDVVDGAVLVQGMYGATVTVNGFKFYLTMTLEAQIQKPKDQKKK